MWHVINQIKTSQHGIISERRTLVFDLDHTLYSKASNFFEKVENRMNVYIADALSVSYEDASHLRHEYFKQYGTTATGLMKHHAINFHEFMHETHQVPLDDIEYDVGLVEIFSKLPHKKYIFSNGHAQHVDRMLDHLGLTAYVDGVMCIERMNFIPKPAISTYEVLCERYQLNPLDIIYFEDLAKNLLPAADLGMSTVLIESDCEVGMEHADDPRIHYKTQNLTKFLLEMHENQCENHF